ncbi:hypothetical protein [Shimia abyssi]
METLAVMREPISWLASWYRYRQRNFMQGHPNSTHNVSFDEFVNAYMRGDKPAFANVGSQAKFLEPRPNGTRINHLFRYEDQSRLLNFLQDRIKQKVSLERRNASPRTQLDLSPETLKKYQRKFSAEFDLYNSIS